jgi:hypothetical protein
MSNDTSGNWGNLAIWAETFQTPDSVNKQLDEFRLYFGDGLVSYNNGAWTTIHVSFVVEITLWDTARNLPSTTPLWTSSTQTTSTQLWTAFDFSTGSLVLDPSQTYALVVVPNYTTDGEFGNIGITQVPFDGNMPGSSFLSGGTAGPVVLSNIAWQNVSGAYDLAYNFAFDQVGGTHQLAAVPEPSVAGLAAGLIALVAAMMRFRIGLKLVHSSSVPNR